MMLRRLITEIEGERQGKLLVLGMLLSWSGIPEV